MLFLSGCAAGDAQVLPDTAGHGFRHMFLIGVQMDGVAFLFRGQRFKPGLLGVQQFLGGLGGILAVADPLPAQVFRCLAMNQSKGTPWASATDANKDRSFCFRLAASTITGNPAARTWPASSASR